MWPTIKRRACRPSASGGKSWPTWAMRKGAELLARGRSGRFQPAVGRRIHRQRRPLARREPGRRPAGHRHRRRRSQAGCLIIHSGARGVHTHNHARRLFRQALDKLLPLAEERGVVAGPRADERRLRRRIHVSQLLRRNAGAGGQLRLRRRSALPSTRIIGGISRSFWSGCRELAPRLALVQLGDARAAAAGRAQSLPAWRWASIPLREIVHRLTAAGYDGFYEVELMGEEIESGRLSRRARPVDPHVRRLDRRRREVAATLRVPQADCSPSICPLGLQSCGIGKSRRRANPAAQAEHGCAGVQFCNYSLMAWR